MKVTLVVVSTRTGFDRPLQKVTNECNASWLLYGFRVCTEPSNLRTSNKSGGIVRPPNGSFESPAMSPSGRVQPTASSGIVERAFTMMQPDRHTNVLAGSTGVGPITVSKGKVETWPVTFPSRHTQWMVEIQQLTEQSLKQIELTGFSDDLLDLYFF